MFNLHQFTIPLCEDGALSPESMVGDVGGLIL